MITTTTPLDRAKLRWYNLRNSPRFQRLFQLAVTILDGATCQSDIDYGLALPDFSVRAVKPNPGIYEIVVDGELMLAYRIIEGNPDAEVEIL